MHLGKIFTVQTDLGSSHIVEVEVDIHKSGLPSFAVVGLGDKAIDESRERVSAAIKNSGYHNPKTNKIVVSLSPAHIKKEGSHFDLPIALGVLLADDEEPLDFAPAGHCFVGELALDGTVRPVNGVLAMTQEAVRSNYHSIYVPQENAAEAALVRNITVYPVKTLKELVLHLDQVDNPSQESYLTLSPQKPTNYQSTSHTPLVDFADVVEQAQAKRALLVAAAGGHNVALYGPAGTGKTMLAKAFCGILPPLTYEQMLETTAIHSYVGLLGKPGYITTAPYRAPHHTSSYVSVIGGGTIPRPGEISLSHHGVLFMDEFPEFDKRVLESLREPMEDHEVRISRARGSVVFPADFILLAALNPPSAVYRDPTTISPGAIRAFSRKISGPIMDRIDVWCEVPKVKHAKLLHHPASGPRSQDLQGQVVRAREQQYQRLGAGRTNAHMTVREIEQHIVLDSKTNNLLNTSAERMNFSPRVYHKLLKLARTIADLEASVDIQEVHILEALSYRPRDIV